jgi:hypothetical protein
MAAPLPPRSVRDVPAEQFIRAYAEHLKANDKVGSCERVAAPFHMMEDLVRKSYRCCSRSVASRSRLYLQTDSCCTNRRASLKCKYTLCRSSCRAGWIS